VTGIGVKQQHHLSWPSRCQRDSRPVPPSSAVAYATAHSARRAASPGFGEQEARVGPYAPGGRASLPSAGLERLDEGNGDELTIVGGSARARRARDRIRDSAGAELSIASATTRIPRLEDRRVIASTGQEARAEPMDRRRTAIGPAELPFSRNRVRFLDCRVRLWRSAASSSRCDDPRRIR